MTRVKRDSGRIPGGFVALPWAVLDSPSYGLLSHPARSLLLELARQYTGSNNGRLLTSAAYLSKRGWNSTDVITRAKRELISAGFIHETVRGCRPNKASWYAVTWQTLDRLPGYDFEALATFRRGGFRPALHLSLVAAKPTREELYARWRDPITSPTVLHREAA